MQSVIRSGIWVGRGTRIDSSVRLTPPLLIGRNCRIEKDVKLIGPTIIDDDSVIREGVALQAVIKLGSGEVGRNAYLMDGIIGDSSSVIRQAYA